MDKTFCSSDAKKEIKSLYNRIDSWQSAIELEERNQLLLKFKRLRLKRWQRQSSTSGIKSTGSIEYFYRYIVFSVRFNGNVSCFMPCWNNGSETKRRRVIW